MTKDEVLKLIEECGATEFGDQQYFNGNEWVESPRFIVDERNLLSFANAIADKQREKDAQIVNHIRKEGGGTYGDAILANKE